MTNETQRFAIAAFRNGRIRAWTTIDDIGCVELARILLDWHGYDPERRPVVVPLFELRSYEDALGEPDQ